MLIETIDEMNHLNIRHAEKLPPIVFVIDDDSSMRAALSSLIRSIGLRVEVFASATDFLATNAKRTDGPSCLILDVRLPGVSGLDFQAELAKTGSVIPIIFITGHGDIPMSVKAIKGGAVEFLTKPFRDQDLLDAVQVALERATSRHTSDKAVSELRAKFETLTHREKEVMEWVTGGLLNKQVAAALGVSEITIKVHRGNVMRKMGAKSLAALVRMADTLAIPRRKRRWLPPHFALWKFGRRADLPTRLSGLALSDRADEQWCKS